MRTYLEFDEEPKLIQRELGNLVDVAGPHAPHTLHLKRWPSTLALQPCPPTSKSKAVNQDCCDFADDEGVSSFSPFSILISSLELSDTKVHGPYIRALLEPLHISAK